ncbi:hypothetical protein JCM8097_006150 [Rhodosporidiobolus ruineniae]
MAVSAASSGSAANPFEQYLKELDSTLFPACGDSAGFARRVWALTGVCALGVLLSLLYGLVLALKHRRKRDYWIARNTDGYLTLNRDFFAPFGGAISCASMLAYTVLQYHLFRHPSPSISTLYSINTFRSFSWVPLVLHGYTVAASAAQASLVVSSRARPADETGQPGWVKRRMRMPGPRAANAAFWTGLGVIALGVLIPDVLFAVSWHRVYGCIERLQRSLKEGAAGWDAASGTPSPTVLQKLLEAQRFFEALTGEVGSNQSYQKAVVWALVVAPLFLASLTLLSAILLHTLLRRQIRTRSRRATAHSLFLADLHTFASPVLPSSPIMAVSPNGGRGRGRTFEVEFPFSAQAQDEQEQENHRKESRVFGSLSLSPTTSFLPVLPSSPHAPLPSSPSPTKSKTRRPGTGDTVKRLLHDGLGGLEKGLESPDGDEVRELKRAERELGITATVVIVLGLALAGENIWNVLRVVPTSFVDLSWAEIETSNFLPPALYTLVYTLAALLLLLNTLFAASSTSSFRTSRSGSASTQGSEGGWWRCDRRAGERTVRGVALGLGKRLSGGGGERRPSEGTVDFI